VIGPRMAKATSSGPDVGIAEETAASENCHRTTAVIGRRRNARSKR
jgi:hypothetical protein